MVPFSIPDIAQFAAAIDGILRVNEGPLDQNVGALYVARYQLYHLLDISPFKSRIRSSRPLAVELSRLINLQIEPYVRDKHFSSFDVYSITSAANQLKTAIFAELGSFKSFLATPKAGYDIDILLETPENLFPSDLIRKVPNATIDIREAAKCLAYEVPSAAGFHVFRVVESVLRAYYHAVTSGSAPPRSRNIGVYTRAIRKCGAGDEKVLTALDNLANLHRNPLAHPEDNLSLDEAVDIFGLARSIISAMLRAIPDPPAQAGLGTLAGLFSAGLTIPSNSSGGSA